MKLESLLIWIAMAGISIFETDLSLIN